MENHGDNKIIIVIMEIIMVDHEYAVKSIALSPDGALIASGDSYGNIKICSTTGDPNPTCIDGNQYTIFSYL
jgi:hypothetical protein